MILGIWYLDIYVFFVLVHAQARSSIPYMSHMTVILCLVQGKMTRRPEQKGHMET